VSPDAAGPGRPEAEADLAGEARLGFLLKHAGLRLRTLSGPLLAPLGVEGREVAVLTVLATRQPLSQLAAARRLAIDRTTMVAMLDALEAKGLVRRGPHPKDRRKNVVAMTPAGRGVLRRATRAVEAAERRFLAPLTAAEGSRLREMLERVTAAPGTDAS